MRRVVILIIFVLLLTGCNSLQKYRVKRGEAWITESGEGICVREGERTPEGLRDNTYKNK